MGLGSWIKKKVEGKVVAISGGFDPIHPGHIAYIKEALSLGNRLLVILTRDDQLVKKKGRFWIPYGERKSMLEWILEGKGKAYKVVQNIDEDITSQDSLQFYMPIHIFAKGGNSWTRENLPEYWVCDFCGIELRFGVGGFDKKRGSSEVKDWTE